MLLHLPVQGRGVDGALISLCPHKRPGLRSVGSLQRLGIIARAVGAIGPGAGAGREAGNLPRRGLIAIYPFHEIAGGKLNAFMDNLHDIMAVKPQGILADRVK